ncbi:hypothetical protein [Mycolicibacter arupensis]|uniref:Uncharacterized protein n=1 Tax=Mycolicibacter arupensis TaxID=342002 RepID=A0A5C7XY92_9MYCO|nr:hypothetical protein [Mycolicibacter arupensis]TXI54469.1 MAG: hypothetical protein E6Q54_14820 [Mycolicibacter arupensis]
MNTTDDGQPVGEDVPVGFQLMGTAHLGSPVSSMLAAADLITARTLAIEEVRSLHVPTGPDELGLFKDCCQACSIRGAGLAVQYPCPTIRILERHGLA